MEPDYREETYLTYCNKGAHIDGDDNDDDDDNEFTWRVKS